MFVEDCRSIGLIVKRPDINTSEYLFKDLNHETILYGLGAIKGIGQSLVDQIIKSREEDSFVNLYSEKIAIFNAPLYQIYLKKISD